MPNDQSRFLNILHMIIINDLIVTIVTIICYLAVLEKPVTSEA